MESKDTVLDFDKDSESEVNTDELHFQDFAHQDGERGELPTPDGAPGKIQTHTFTNFPNPDESDEEDKADLLKGDKKQSSFWTFDYYQAYFDVDTNQVLRRILGSMVPNPRSNYLQTQIRPNPDFYGPFWICTTLVFTTAIAGNLANYIQHAGKNYQWQYDFHQVTFAASAIFGYWWVVPTLLWCLLWWRKNPAGYTFTEIICVYGYSLAIYIPISILWVVQVWWLQWLLVMLGMVLSGTVLLLNFWPALREEDKKLAMTAMGVIFVLHGLLAVGFMLYFFKVPSSTSFPITTGGNDTQSLSFSSTVTTAPASRSSPIPLRTTTS